MQLNITALTLFIVINDYGVVGRELTNLHKFLPGADYKFDIQHLLANKSIF